MPPLAGAAAYNAPLLDRPGGRARLETPALLLDLDAFTANLDRMAQVTRAGGLSLRPHAKSHKCAEIGRRQIAAGALGLCCAKPGELLALFEGGIRPLMLSAPVASPAKIDALARAAGAGAALSVVVTAGSGDGLRRGCPPAWGEDRRVDRPRCRPEAHRGRHARRGRDAGASGRRHAGAALCGRSGLCGPRAARA